MSKLTIPIGTVLGEFYDELLGAPYELWDVNAKKLSEYLRKLLKNKNIDYNHYNPDGDIEKIYSWQRDEYLQSIQNPPKEIYEYQNFVLYHNQDRNEYFLLDGFRRLLWYEAPDMNIRVRVYRKYYNNDESILTDQQIFKLLLYLNHFKFFGGSNYMDRGFALLIHMVFGLDITKYKQTFDAYLWSNQIENSYSYNRPDSTKRNNLIKERILNPHFLRDIYFIESLNNAGQMVNQYFGALLYQERIKTDKDFDPDYFLALAKENKVLDKLLERFHKVGTTNGADSQKVVNQIIEIYQNIFKTMSGETIEMSYAEKVKESKDLVAELKKDKEWTKMTGYKNYWEIDRYLVAQYKKGADLKFKCVVYPYEHKLDREQKPLPHGLNTDVVILKYVPEVAWKHSEHLILGLVKDGVEYRVQHNWGDGAKKYTKLSAWSTLPNTTHSIELFVNIPQNVLKK